MVVHHLPIRSLAPLAPPLQATADPATVALGLLTQLGDVWFVTVLAIVVYWLGRRTPLVGDGVDRERLATVLGAVFLAVVLSVALKAWFATPRPPGVVPAPTVPGPTAESVTAWLVGADGPAFPSGHGVLVTVGWGGLAWAIRTGSVRVRAGVAAAVVLLVGASRVALGLHTPEQVLAGIVVGLLVLAVVLARGAPRKSGAWGPTWAFALALVAAVVAIPAVGFYPEVLTVAGLAAGGLLAWHRWGDALADRDRSSGLGALAVGFATVFPALVVMAVLVLHLLLHLLASALVGALIVALPLFGSR